ncbi:MAG: RNase A-like domain-containing protein [Jatrophihabitantaceae bacterium]
MVVSRFELPGNGLLAARLCLAQRMPAGDPVRIRAAANRSGAWASDLRRVGSTLLASADTPLWTGAAHQAFVDRIRAHAPSIAATADRYEHYAHALTLYAGALDETAPRLLAAHGQLRQRCDELVRPEQAALSFGATAFAGSQPSPDAPDLLLIARDFKAGYDRWADALDRCIRALSQADEADPTRDAHGFSAFGHSLAAAAQRHLSPFHRAVLHPSLRNLSDCLGTLNVELSVLGLALVFICPPAGAACLAAATVLAVAQLAVDATRRAQGEQVSNASLGLQLAAAIPLGGSAVRGLRAADNVTHLVPGGGLAAHEGLEGGHTLAKHVGKSPEFLRNRLATESKITGASSFYNREVAENSISEVLKTNEKSIQNWLAGPKRKLVISSPTSQVCGSMFRALGADPIESSAIRVVLRRSDALGLGYRIHTAMVIR